MLGLLRLVPLPVWGALGAGALAIGIAVAWFIDNRATNRALLKVERQIVVREREINNRNAKFDTTTTIEDSRFFRELRELEDTWLFNDTTPAPMAGSPAPTAAAEPRPQPEMPEPLKSLLEPQPSQSP
jgi:hypothetical protein